MSRACSKRECSRSQLTRSLPSRGLPTMISCSRPTAEHVISHGVQAGLTSLPQFGKAARRAGWLVYRVLSKYCLVAMCNSNQSWRGWSGAAMLMAAIHAECTCHVENRVMGSFGYRHCMPCYNKAMPYVRLSQQPLLLFGKQQVTVSVKQIQQHLLKNALSLQEKLVLR